MMSDWDKPKPRPWRQFRMTCILTRSYVSQARYLIRTQTYIWLYGHIITTYIVIYHPQWIDALPPQVHLRPTYTIYTVSPVNDWWFTSICVSSLLLASSRRNVTQSVQNEMDRNGAVDSVQCRPRKMDPHIYSKRKKMSRWVVGFSIEYHLLCTKIGPNHRLNQSSRERR